MIAAQDSSYDAPTLAQAQAARAAGVRAWGGYLATRPNVGLAVPWSRAAFANVQQAGLRALAFCSGWDDPVALRQLAAQWNVLLLVDVEDAIRGDGPWVGPFLQASGAGLYGLLEVHRWPAPYRIVAEYPAGGCPGATWPSSPAPQEPHGWQCQGTHRDPVTGLSVDSMRLDDWFATGGTFMGLTDKQQQDMFTFVERVATLLGAGVEEQDPADTGQWTPVQGPLTTWLPDQLAALQAAVGRLQQPTVDPAALAAALVADQAFLDGLAAALLHRAGAALGGA